ncbi:MAG: hypothetical protein WCO79_01805 [bacterium]
MNQIHHTNSNMIKMIGAAVIIAALAFYAGLSYGKRSSSVIATTGQGTNFSARTGGAGFAGGGTTAGGRRAVAGGGFATGEVLSKDASGVTLKLQDGGTKIIFIATSTQVMKATIGSLADLAVGTNVTIMGTTNSDGSIAAKSVQIRPNGTNR